MSRRPAAPRRRPTGRRRHEQDVGRASVDPTTERIDRVLRPYLIWFAQAQQLPRERKPPPEVAYQQVRTLLQNSLVELKVGLNPQDVDDLRYAMVAFADEAMQLEPGPLRDFWQSHLLQLEHLGTTRAGEGFFERLQRIKEDPSRTGILRAYYLCLLFGLQGIYGQHGELERENLIDDVRHCLEERSGASTAPPLAPHGRRPDEPGVDRERNRLLQWLAIAAAIVSVVWYVGLVFTVDAQERALSERLQHMYEDLRTGFVAVE